MQQYTFNPEYFSLCMHAYMQATAVHLSTCDPQDIVSSPCILRVFSVSPSSPQSVHRHIRAMAFHPVQRLLCGLYRHQYLRRLLGHTLHCQADFGTWSSSLVHLHYLDTCGSRFQVGVCGACLSLPDGSRRRGYLSCYSAPTGQMASEGQTHLCQYTHLCR